MTGILILIIVVVSDSTAYKSTRAKKSQLIRLRDELLEKEKKNG